MSVGAAYYEGIIDALYTALSGLDVTGYRGAPSDGWTRARHLELGASDVRHLEAWIDLGAIKSIGRSEIEHDAGIVFACRYSAGDDGRSQGIMHGATRAIVDLLVAWSAPSGARARPPMSTSIEALGPDWVLITVRFILHIPRGD